MKRTPLIARSARVTCFIDGAPCHPSTAVVICCEGSCRGQVWAVWGKLAS